MGRHVKSAHIPPFSKIRALIERHVKDVAEQEISDYAVELKNRLVNGILRQTFESFRRFPLNPRYLEWKRKKKLDPRTLVATGRYVRKIKILPRGRFVYEIGFPRNAKVRDIDGKEKDLTLNELANILEYGSESAGIPPRPHWGIIYQQGQRDAVKVARQISEKAAKRINKDLKRGQNR